MFVLLLVLISLFFLLGFSFALDYFGLFNCLRFVNWRILEDIGCELVLIIDFAIERAGITLATNSVIKDVHVELRQFASYV